jgi:hypothetical protein
VLSMYGRRISDALALPAWIAANVAFAIMVAFCLQLIPIVNSMEDYLTGMLAETTAGRVELAGPAVKAGIILGVLASVTSLLVGWKASPRPPRRRPEWWIVVTAAAVAVIIISGGILSASRYVAGLPPIMPGGEDFTTRPASAPAS